MSITFHHNNIVHIKNSAISYVMEVVDGKYLVNRYFGKSLREYRLSGIPHYFKRGYNTEHDCSIENVSFDDFPFEYPVRGFGDYRIPAITVTQQNGIEFINPIFKSWKILSEKPQLDGLPSTFAGNSKVETLEILCEDKQAGLQIFLYYSIFDDKGIITRHQKIVNTGNQTLKLQNVQSLSIELPAQDYDFLSLFGTHAKEANINRFPIHHGIQKIESVRGSSSPQHQPFFALMSPQTTENNGEVYGFHLVYSGNFIAQVEKDQFGSIRAQIGLNKDEFCWTLSAGQSFTTPEAILNYSCNGLNGMSQNFHWLYKNHLMPKRFSDKIRPILLNSWESMYYDVSLDKIDVQSTIAKKLGIELFVLDDGWFRKENNSYSSMGDWVCNENKLAGGIKKVAELIHSKGMQFGLWFEPEAISENSDLYRTHPDWALHIPNYKPTKGRHEYLLDLSREDVQNFIIEILDLYLKDNLIDYIKWDMNRPLTDVNSILIDTERKGEVSHRYVLGLYKVLDTITKKYPDVLIEGCSSGGARFDPAMLYYVPQNWTSDNTDAFDRIGIQFGYSLLYPPIAMGAHVSITPNHQTGRTTSLNTRYQVAKLFNLGYELDLTKCTDEEQNEIANQIKQHKIERSWQLNANLLRNDSPNENYAVWSLVNEDKSQFEVIIFQKFHNPLFSHGKFKLYGLNPDFDYMNVNDNLIFGGDELMQIGLTVPLVKEDFHAFSFKFVKI